jgi:arylsulfatase
MKRQRITYALALLTVTMALTGAAAPAHAQDKKPNIVFMLTDNLGYGELGSYGGGILRRTHPAH